jgi:hypothetical protein
MDSAEIAPFISSGFPFDNRAGRFGVIAFPLIPGHPLRIVSIHGHAGLSPPRRSAPLDARMDIGHEGQAQKTDPPPRGTELLS